MSVRRVPIPDLASGERRVDGLTAHYLGRVLRVHRGDTFVAFDASTGREADAVALEVNADTLVLDVGPLRDGALLPARSIAWIQGLAKGDKCDAVVRDATELGATRILVTKTHRSVVKLDAAQARAKARRWAKIALEAARQSGRSDEPRVELPLSWADALSGAGEADLRFCLWEEASDPLAPRLLEALGSGRSLAFACGPEGGLEASEVSLAREQGWHVVSLGRRTLRTETVAAAVLGTVQICSMG